MSRVIALICLVLALSATACADDCDALVDDVCARLGEQHEACQRARKRLDSVSQDDKRLCRSALALTKRLTPKN